MKLGRRCRHTEIYSLVDGGLISLSFPRFLVVFELVFSLSLSLYLSILSFSLLFSLKFLLKKKEKYKRKRGEVEKLPGKQACIRGIETQKWRAKKS